MSKKEALLQLGYAMVGAAFCSLLLYIAGLILINWSFSSPPETKKANVEGSELTVYNLSVVNTEEALSEEALYELIAAINQYELKTMYENADLIFLETEHTK